MMGSPRGSTGSLRYKDFTCQPDSSSVLAARRPIKPDAPVKKAIPLFILALFSSPLLGQSITITTPADAATVTGIITTAVTIASLPSLCSVEWRLNNDASFLPARAQSEATISRAHPWSYSLKSQALFDGSYTITAIARDCLGAQLATDTNSFTVDNHAASISQTAPADPAADVTTTSNWTVVSSGVTTCRMTAYIDGREISSEDACSRTISVNPALYRNGAHVLEMSVVDRTVGSLTFAAVVALHRWNANFATAASTAMELRTNAYNAVLVAGGATHTVTGFIANTDGTTSAATISCVSDLPSIASVSSCVVTPVASGLATITVTDSGTGKTAKVYAFVRTSTNTPHFGSDRTMRTTYDSTVSRYIRSMFFFEKQYLDADSVLRTEATKSGLNMMEGNVYSGQPGNTGQNESAWKTAQDAVTSGLSTTLGTLDSKFKLLCLGDGMFGGSGLADDIGGPGQQTWTDKPVPYMAAWAKANCVNMEVEDEINAGYGGQPRPRFTMGQDMSKVVVASGTATATFVNRQCGGPPGYPPNMVGGVTSGLNATNVSSFTCTGQYTATWTTSAANGEYNFSGTGCSGSPCVAEPNYQIKIFINLPVYTTSPTTPAVPETGFTDLVTLMTASSTRPNIAWPLIGGSTVGTYEAWTKDSAFADYTSMYTNCGNAECGVVHPLGLSMAQAKGTLELTWRSIFPGIQTEKPMLSISQGAGQSFNRGGKSASVTSVVGNLVTSASSNAAPSGKARIQGASNNAHNNWFHIGKVFSATSYEIMDRLVTSVAGDCTSGTVTGEGGAWTRTINLMNFNGVSVTAAFPSLAVGDHFTVSGCTPSGFNKEWIYLASDSSTNIQYRDYPTASSTGGTIRIAANSDYDPTYDTPLAPGSNLKTAFVSNVFAWMLPGNSGTRSYGFDRGSAVIRAAAFPYVWARRSDSSLTNIVVSGGTATVNFAEPHRMTGTLELRIRGVTTAGGTSLNVDPIIFANCDVSSTSCTFATGASNGTYTDSTMDVRGFLSASEQQTFSDPTRGNSRLVWRAQGYAWNLFQRIEPFALQPILPSPDYGWCLPSAVRGPSTYGRVLLVLNTCEVAITQTIDYSAYVYSGKPISEYRADWTGIRTRVASGTSESYTIQPGEVIALLFHDASSAYVVASTLTARPTDQPTASKVALRYGYIYNEALDLVTATVSCSAGICSPGWDRRLGDIWFWYEYLNSSDVVQARSDRIRLTQL